MKNQISVGSTEAVRLVLPGDLCRMVVVQNSTATSSNIRVTFDGGASLPTASTGIQMIPGADLTINAKGAPSDKILSVWAIAETGTATVDVETDDTASI